MIKKIEKSEFKLIVLLIIAYTLYCGYYEWTSAIISIIILLILICSNSLNRIVSDNSNYLNYIPHIIILLIIITNFWAIDKSLSIYGLLKIGAAYLWYILIKTKKNRNSIIKIIPILGIYSVIIGIISLLNNNIKEIFWIADRFGGLFQYANTNALFLLICLIINFETNDNKIKRNINLVILLVGLLFTGSRSITIIYVCYLIYKLIVNNYKKGYIIQLILLISITVFALVVSGINNNISRIFSIVNHNSTLWGRLLYIVDSLKLLYRYPFGMGYMGYSYLVPTVQSGVYTILYVHNDILQIVLDYGVITLLFISILLIYQFKNGKQELYKKEILLIIIVSSFFDIHLQYIFVLMLIILLMDFEYSENIIYKRNSIKLIYFLILIIEMYLFISPFCYYIGNDTVPNMLYPRYTPSQVRLSTNISDKEIAKEISLDIIKHNKYEKSAYNNLAYAALIEKDYQTASDMKLRKIILSPYDKEEYKDSMKFGDKLLSVDISNNYLKKRNLYYENIRKRTSTLAYKIKDKPIWIDE